MTYESIAESITEFTVEEIEVKTKNLLETFYLLPEVKEKKRGRPKKNAPRIDGTIVHRMEDDTHDNRVLLPVTKHKIALDFLEYIEEGKSRRGALLMVASLYQIPYSQAYTLCEHV
jgi:hypothetical protein